MNWVFIPDDADTALVSYAKNNQIEDHCTWQASTLDYILSFYNKKTFRRCIDAGANYGFMSVGFSRYFEKVEAFEISPIIQPYLKTNVSTFNNIEVHSKGLYNKQTQVYFKQNPTSGTSRISKTETELKPKVDTLDSYQFKDVDLIKMDIEGAEPEAIEGALQTIKYSLPVLVIEMNFNRSNEGLKGRQYIFSELYKLNYTIIDIRHNDVLFMVK